MEDALRESRGNKSSFDQVNSDPREKTRRIKIPSTKWYNNRKIKLF
jgi:hypothetical protein